MTLQDFADVVEMRGNQTLIIYSGLNRVDITSDDELSALSARTLSRPVLKITPILDGIAVRID